MTKSESHETGKVRNLCPICLSTNVLLAFALSPLFEPSIDVTYLSCGDCGCIFRSDRRALDYSKTCIYPLKAYLERQYGHPYFSYLFSNLTRAVSILGAVSKTTTHTNDHKVPKRRRPLTPSLAEVGCAAGLFLDMPRFAGWKVLGIEPNKEYATWGQQNLKLEIIQNTVEKSKLRNRFDIVVALEVVEHSENALHFVRSLRRLLRGDGILLLTTPNGESNEFKSSDESLITDGGAHTLILSETSLATLLHRGGFNSVRIFVFGGRFGDQRLVAVATTDSNAKMKCIRLFSKVDVTSDPGAARFSREYLMNTIHILKPSNHIWQTAAFRLSEWYCASQQYDLAEELSRSVESELDKRGLSADAILGIVEEVGKSRNHTRLINEIPAYLPDLLNVRGIALLSLKRYAEANVRFKLASAILGSLAKVPKTHVAWGDQLLQAFTLSRSGIAELNLGSTENALRAFREGLAVSPSDDRLKAEIFFNMALANLQRGNLQASLDDLCRISESATDLDNLRLFLRGFTQFVKSGEGSLKHEVDTLRDQLTRHELRERPISSRLLRLLRRSPVERERMTS